MARMTAGLATALLGVLLLALPAAAQYPPVEETTVTVATTVVTAGGTLTISGDGWLPGSTVSLTLLSDPVDLGTAAVDDDGEFSTAVTIPADTPPGDHTIRVAGTGADGAPRTVDLTITVQGSGAGGAGAAEGAAAGGGLASTGGFFSSTSALGALLLVVGGGALFASRRLTRSGAARR